MSFIIRIPGADFSNSGLPKARRTARGFLKDGLVGLFLLEEGTVGSSYAGPWADSSGNGQQLTLFTNRTSPVRRSYGLELASANGLILQSDINSNLQAFTVIAGIKSKLPGNEASVYSHWFGATDNSYPSDPAASHSSNSYPSPNFAGNALYGAGDYAVYANNSATFGSNRAMRLTPPTGASNNDPVALAYRIDGPGARGAQSSLSGLIKEVTDADISTAFNGGQTGYFTFGWFPFGPARSAVAAQAELYGFAIYNRYLSDDDTIEALKSMNNIAAARGVALNGA